MSRACLILACLLAVTARAEPQILITRPATQPVHRVAVAVETIQRVTYDDGSVHERTLGVVRLSRE